MNTKIIITCITLLIIVGVIITIGFSPHSFQKNTPEQDIQSNQTIKSEQTIQTQQTIETSSSTEDDMVLRRDRDDRARGAQKQNSDAATLQNDLNSIGNP